jgi:hypothetical protein
MSDGRKKILNCTLKETKFTKTTEKMNKIVQSSIGQKAEILMLMLTMSQIQCCLSVFPSGWEQH